jgi:mono/diheme cytochrome c family protein
MALTTILRLVKWVVVFLIVLLAGGVAAVYALSERRLNARYDVPTSELAISTADASVERGAHLVRSVGACVLCHGQDLGGGVYADMGPVGIVAGPNLTRGRGGLATTFELADWVRAIRYGVRRDGTSLIMMPSEEFTNLSDEDVSSIVAYLEQAPPVDREVPASTFRPVGRALLATGRLEILTAPKTKHPRTIANIPVKAGRDYGRYLADVSGCHGCHGDGLSGGQVAGPPGLPPASNLTPAGLGKWTERDFVRAIRQGLKLDGTPINEFMPWKVYAAMTDVELHALWEYLESVPSRPFGQK